jgi:hypothetical protein
MRRPVDVLLDMLASGMSNAEILADHPELEHEDIRAALQYTRLLASGHTLKQAAWRDWGQSMVKVKIYVEGGGDNNSALVAECCKGFTQFFQKAGFKGYPL